MAELIVREATVEDADAVARVHVGTWQSAYRGLLPDEYLDALDAARRADVWRSGLLSDPHRPVWVSEVAGRVMGFANVGPSNDEEGIGEMYAIYVDSGHWDTGAGRALVAAALEWLRARYPQATLWVLQSNDRARRFYEKGGWRFDGATKDDDRGSFVLHEVRYRIDL